MSNTEFVEPGTEISALEAARRLQVDLNRLYVLLRLGRVVGRKVEGQWLVLSSSVEQRGCARNWQNG
jgi:hypothetical protein